MKQFFPTLFLMLLCSVAYAQQQDSVTISGRVTDYGGQPIDSACVWWQNPQSNNVIEAITDKNGHYTARVLKGNYQKVASIYLPSYAHVAMKTACPKRNTVWNSGHGILSPTVIPRLIFVTTAWRSMDCMLSVSLVLCLPTRYMFAP